MTTTMAPNALHELLKQQEYDAYAVLEDWGKGKYGDLMHYDTGSRARAATALEAEESLLSPQGVITVEGDDYYVSF